MPDQNKIWETTLNQEDLSVTDLAKQLCQRTNMSVTTLAVEVGQVMFWASRSYDTSLLGAIVHELQTGNIRQADRGCINTLCFCAVEVARATQYALGVQRKLIESRVSEMYSGTSDWWQSPLSESVQLTPIQLWDKSNYLAVIEACEREYLTWQISNEISNKRG